MEIESFRVYNLVSASGSIIYYISKWQVSLSISNLFFLKLIDRSIKKIIHVYRRNNLRVKIQKYIWQVIKLKMRNVACHEESPKKPLAPSRHRARVISSAAFACTRDERRARCMNNLCEYIEFLITNRPEIPPLSAKRSIKTPTQQRRWISRTSRTGRLICWAGEFILDVASSHLGHSYIAERASPPPPPPPRYYFSHVLGESPRLYHVPLINPQLLITTVSDSIASNWPPIVSRSIYIVQRKSNYYYTAAKCIRWK